MEKEPTICSDRECKRVRHRRSEWCHMHYERVRRHGNTSALFTFHNMCYTPEYESWHQMKARCHNPANHAYRYYGARGIQVCDEWRQDFQAFYNHIGPKPGKGYSVNRIDNDGNYEPGNVEWATAVEQANNTRANRLVEHNGEVHTVTEWARVFGVRAGMLFHRLYEDRDIFKGLD